MDTRCFLHVRAPASDLRNRWYCHFRMPIYEYRCPNGHVFERFQSMTAPAPEKCDACGAVPVALVLYPVAIHYKGSGFYSTDYGKKKPATKDSDSGSGDAPKKSDDSGSKPPEKKAAASGD
jgi:putative FmdB family regulatory protein